MLIAATQSLHPFIHFIFPMKNLLIHYAPRLAGVLLLLGLTVALSHAQVPGGGGPQPGGGAGGATTTPIDGGVSLLLAGGVAFGLKKLRRPRQKSA